MPLMYNEMELVLLVISVLRKNEGGSLVREFDNEVDHGENLVVSDVLNDID